MWRVLLLVHTLIVQAAFQVCNTSQVCYPVTVYRTGGLAGYEACCGMCYNGCRPSNLCTARFAGCAWVFVGTLLSASSAPVEVRWPLKSGANSSTVETQAVDAHGRKVFNSVTATMSPYAFTIVSASLLSFNHSRNTLPNYCNNSIDVFTERMSTNNTINITNNISQVVFPVAVYRLFAWTVPRLHHYFSCVPEVGLLNEQSEVLIGYLTSTNSAITVYYPSANASNEVTSQTPTLSLPNVSGVGFQIVAIDAYGRTVYSSSETNCTLMMSQSSSVCDDSKMQLRLAQHTVTGSQLSIVTSWTFSAVGAVQQLRLSRTGSYTIEVWGAAGGGNASVKGGFGGYVRANFIFKAGTQLLVYVGQQGKYVYLPSLISGGGVFGGGGPTNYNFGGGGATDVRMNSSLESRFIVAGGGGGAGLNESGGCGGGDVACAARGVSGGGQAAGGFSLCDYGGFGFAGDELRSIFSASGGGGYYAGAAPCLLGGAASGGSSYVSADGTEVRNYRNSNAGPGKATVTFQGVPCTCSSPNAGIEYTCVDSEYTGRCKPTQRCVFDTTWLAPQQLIPACKVLCSCNATGVNGDYTCTDPSKSGTCSNPSETCNLKGRWFSTSFPCGPPSCAAVELPEGVDIGNCSKPVVNNGDTNVIILSPTVEILGNPVNNISFTIPFDRELRAEITRKITAQSGCLQAVLRCEWLDPETNTWSASGCELSSDFVMLPDGRVGSTCECMHLTVFSLVLRADNQAETFCEARPIDFVFIALYILLTVICFIQIIRVFEILCHKKQTKAFLKGVRDLLFQHIALFVAFVMRVTYFIAKGTESGAVLLLLGLLPFALSLSMFLFLVTTWASLQLFSMSSSPFARLRYLFMCIVSLLFAVSILLPVLFATLDGSQHAQVLLSGTIVLTVLTGIACISIFVVGISLVRVLNHGASSTKSQSLDSVSRRVLSITILLSVLLLLESCLWAVAIDHGVLESSVATVAVSAIFYAVDLLSVSVLMYLLNGGVQRFATQKTQSTTTTNEHSKSERSHVALSS